MLGTERGSGGGADVLAESLFAETRLLKALDGPPGPRNASEPISSPGGLGLALFAESHG
jgi:hypothetical protein